MNVRHYHVTERVGQTERVVATFASAFQAGRDMALRERSSQAIERERQEEPALAFPTVEDDRRDAARRELPPRAVISYVACTCTNAPVIGPASAV
ncbi:MAG: hypothetical protein ACREQ5_39240 [Candidatus Dormibacteria bacterium]